MPSARPYAPPGRRAGGRVLILSMALSALSALALLMAPLGSQAGLWTFRGGFTLLRWSAYGAMAAGAVGLVGMLLSRRWGAGTAVVVLSLVVLAVPLQWLRIAQGVPPIHDITTDPDNPPLFEAVVPLRQDARNPPEYDPAVADVQRAAYPDLQPLTLPLQRTQAFAVALDAARAQGWEIVAADEPRGRIEAVDTTFWFRFKDDVVVRLAEEGDGIRIDVRSKSRVGRSDVGTNARRIRRFLEDVRNRATAGS